MFDGIVLYFWWNIWKEWNQRTFQPQELHPRQVAFLVKYEVQRFQLVTQQAIVSS